MMLSEHFSLLEFVQSDIAARHGIDNTPSPAIIANLIKVANLLEHVRIIIRKKPMKISSGYRCAELNRLVKGSNTSAHMTGCAADFTVPGYGAPYDVCVKIRDSKLKFGQLIYEYAEWTHLSIGSGRMVLTKTYNQPYRLGLFNL